MLGGRRPLYVFVGSGLGAEIWTEHDGDYGQFFDPYFHLEVIPALNLAIGRSDEA